MRTYNASAAQVLWKLRFPSAVPFLFASMKVAVAISLVGAIVGELPTGAVAGLGARLLTGSYYGQTVQIWSALIAAALIAAVLVAIVGLAERIVLRRMGVCRHERARRRNSSIRPFAHRAGRAGAARSRSGGPAVMGSRLLLRRRRRSCIAGADAACGFPALAAHR